MTGLARTRRALGLSQADVAQAIGCSQTLYSRIERGAIRPSARLAERLDRLFGDLERSRRSRQSFETLGRAIAAEILALR